MSNTQSKLNRLIDTKTNLRQKLISLGVDVPIDTPFKDYPDLMEQLGGIEITETTTDQDLLQMVDLYHYLGSAEYEDYTYSDEEIANVHDLLDTIIDGEEIVEPEIGVPTLLVTTVGDAYYHVGETFSLDGYTVTAIYNDGRKVDVTENCSFAPSFELLLEDECVTISCEIDGVLLSTKQSITVTEAPVFVDYIQSSGTQYIDTGFIPNQNTRIVIDFQYTKNDKGYRLIGSEHSAGTQQFRFGTSGGTSWLAGYGSSGRTTYGTCDTDRHTLDFNKNIVSLDDSVILEFEEQTFVAFDTAYVFSINSNSIADLAHARVFSCKIYDGDTLMRDFKPCQEGVDGTYCLYDAISKKYYHNYGTGAFTGGKLLEPEPLEYIESTGTQYIDTGIKGSIKNRIELDLQYVGDINRFQINGLLYRDMRNDIGLVDSKVFWGVSTNSVSSTTAGDNERHTYFVDCTNGSYGMDGSTIGSVTPATSSDSTVNVLIGARKLENGNIEAFCYERIFGGKYYISGTLVRDFVPWKDEFGTTCLHDKVENKNYYNKGTGKFLGPIPNNLTVLNYIETTGTQYINTNISAPNGYRAVLKTNITSFTDGYSVLIGAHERSSPYKDNYLRYLNTGAVQLGIYNAVNVSNITLQTGIDYVIDSNNVYSNYYLKVNGTSAIFRGDPSSSTKSDKTLGLMGLHTGNTAGTQFTKAKLYYCEIYSDANVILRYFIPCKDDHEVVCMYDRVSEQYFYNQGTGEFLGE